MEGRLFRRVDMPVSFSIVPHVNCGMGVMTGAVVKEFDLGGKFLATYVSQAGIYHLSVIGGEDFSNTWSGPSGPCSTLGAPVLGRVWPVAAPVLERPAMD